jgi:hypothetical protein
MLVRRATPRRQDLSAAEIRGVPIRAVEGHMHRLMVLGVVAALAIGACNGASNASSSPQTADLQRQVDTLAIEQIEVKWHQASSKKDIDLMMSLWADTATFTVGGQTYAGKDQIRTFFATKAAPFQPENRWVSDTPAYKIRTTVDGDKGTLYFECDYIDVDTKQVVNVVGADQGVARINGTWLITNSVAAAPVMEP